MKCLSTITARLKKQKTSQTCETRPRIVCDFCKVCKRCVGGCSPSGRILFVSETPTYKFAKFWVFILESITTNKHTVKVSLNFVIEPFH